MTLILNDGDVRSLLTPRDAVEAVREAFRQQGLGRVELPPKMDLPFSRSKSLLRLMPAYLEGFPAAGTKLICLDPTLARRPKTFTILVDPESLEILAFIGQAWLTPFRTGAAAAVATEALARRDSRRVGIIGTGHVAETLLPAMREVMQIEEVRVYSRTPAHREEFARRMAESLELDVRPVGCAREAAEGADVVCTATSASSPLLMADDIRPGTHINAMGAAMPGKQELDPAILRKARVVVDFLAQAVERGEVSRPLSQGLLETSDIYGELGEIAAGRKPGRQSAEEITVFDATGIATQDVAVCWKVYQLALERGAGQRVHLV
jgi:alanine dehydrogenase